MSRYALLSFLLAVLTIFSASTSFAWDNSIEIGYGVSHRPGTDRTNNTGFLLSGDILPIYRTDMTYWTVNGSLGQWHAVNAPASTNTDMTTGALSLFLRLYALDFDENIPAYVLGAIGPAVMSESEFAGDSQASRLTLQLNAGFGAEINNWDINLRLTSFSNLGLRSPNQPINILYTLSLGYLF